MKILIVDDEPLARSRLQDLLEDIGGHEVVGEASNGHEALELAQGLQAEIVLLDIHMPELDGLEVARRLNQQGSKAAVIFTTAYSEHALEAFDANAIDYLLKPIRQARLEQALDKASPLSQAQLDAISPADPGQTRQNISTQMHGTVKLIPIDDIYYFQSDSKYVVVHHRGGESLIDEPLKSLEQEFNQRFTRVHRNALVANAYIEALEKTVEGSFQIRLSGCDNALEVSRRQLPSVRKIIAQL